MLPEGPMEDIEMTYTAGEPTSGGGSHGDTELVERAEGEMEMTEMTNTARDATSGAGSPVVTELDKLFEGTMENREMTYTAGEPSGAGSHGDAEPDELPVVRETQDVEIPATVDDPTSGACSPKIAVGKLLSRFRQKKLWIVVVILVVAVFAVIGLTIAGNMHWNNASKEDHLHGYTMLPAHEVYRPKPSFVLVNMVLEQCMEKALTNNDTEARAFQFCASEGMELGRCELFTGNISRLRTRLADSCDVYTHGDPADLGIPHGAAAKTGLVGGLFWILVIVVLRQLTHLLLDC